MIALPFLIAAAAKAVAATVKKLLELLLQMDI